MYCKVCDNVISPPRRASLGYDTCLSCGDKEAKQKVHTVVPMHKSNYVLVTNLSELVNINTKGA